MELCASVRNAIAHWCFGKSLRSFLKPKNRKFERYQEYKWNFTVFLDQAMEKLATLNQTQQEQFEKNLWKALQTCHDLFDQHIFSKSILKGHNRKNGALFEVWTVLVGQLNEDQIEHLLLSKPNIIEEFQFLLKNNTDFFDSISGKHWHKRIIIKRFETIESLIKKYLS